MLNYQPGKLLSISLLGGLKGRSQHLLPHASVASCFSLSSQSAKGLVSMRQASEGRNWRKRPWTGPSFPPSSSPYARDPEGLADQSCKCGLSLGNFPPAPKERSGVAKIYSWMQADRIQEVPSIHTCVASCPLPEAFLRTRSIARSFLTSPKASATRESPQQRTPKPALHCPASTLGPASHLSLLYCLQLQ